MQAKTSCALKSYNNITQKLVVIDSLHPYCVYLHHNGITILKIQNKKW